MNKKLPIRKLLASINHSFSGYLIYFYYILFDRAKDANIHEIKSKRLLAQKVVLVEEELGGIEI